MGFPTWTLLGMGLAMLGTLLSLTLALLGQSPGLLNRLGLSGARLDARARSFTGYALAMLLLTLGFFLAGVPLGPEQNTVESVGDAELQVSGTVTTPAAEPGGSPLSATIPTTPETGAFGGPPTSLMTPTVGTTTEPSVSVSPDDQTEPTAESTFTRTPSSTPTSSPTPTSTATPFPTETPTPTQTPTPIRGETAFVDTQGSTIWLHRLPGGQNLVTIRDQEVVILLDGHANHSGMLWREVRTVNGLVGWVREEYLTLST